MTAQNVRSSRKVYDVAILGTGLGGTVLGTILAKNGLKVLMLEQGVHPRFTIGESTVPETTLLLRLLSARYGVPEIEHLSNYYQVHRFVGTSCGVKRNFSFFYHRPDSEQIPAESTQLNTVGPPLGPDVHLFRQDTDAYMLAVAVSYGVDVRQRVDVTDVDINGTGVILSSHAGEEFRAKYVVDAGGLKSMLAHKFGLRVEPCPMRTRSRSIFSHMVGVAPYDLCTTRSHGLLSPPSEGTLHHLFDGGWMWVIPFNNHPGSTNQLVSVGLNLNIDAHPPNDLRPEDEFSKFVERFPGIKKQFQSAVAIREWTGTNRLQFYSSRSVGDRFCMLPHAFSFIDPLYSSGLGITMSSINNIASRLIAAARDGDFSQERFEYVDRWMKWNIQHFDDLVSGSYTAFRDFDLWNAWYRVWMVGGLLGSFSVFEQFKHAHNSKDPIGDPFFESFPYRGAQGSEIPEYHELFVQAVSHMNQVTTGEKTPAEVTGKLLENIRSSGLWPKPWGRLDPAKKRHAGTFTLGALYRNAFWLRHRAPKGVKMHLYVEANAFDMILAAVRDIGQQLRHSFRMARILVRDYMKDWNRDPWFTGNRTGLLTAITGAKPKPLSFGSAKTQNEEVVAPAGAASLQPESRPVP